MKERVRSSWIGYRRWWAGRKAVADTPNCRSGRRWFSADRWHLADQPGSCGSSATASVLPAAPIRCTSCPNRPPGLRWWPWSRRLWWFLCWVPTRCDNHRWMALNVSYYRDSWQRCGLRRDWQRRRARPDAPSSRPVQLRRWSPTSVPSYCERAPPDRELLCRSRLSRDWAPTSTNE